ncbi:MAG: hypothetical protein IPK88_11515 [Saprospiraceae bacterium]|nr:hypothetical protein [Candidatus Defluviibacterium haderslevense]
MKSVFVIVLVLLNALLSPIYSQDFEDFTIDKEVIIFLKKQFKDLKDFQLGIKVKNDDNQLYLDSIEYSSWFVGDFNDDGLNDLFVTGNQKKENVTYLIIAKEDADVFELVHVQPMIVEGDLNIPIIEETKNGPLIIYKQFATEQKLTTVKGREVKYPKIFSDYYKMGFIRKDTLVYKFNGIIEYNSMPSKIPLRYLQLHSYCQFGGCPDYIIKIDSSGRIIINNIKNTNSEPGIQKSTCELSVFLKLQQLLQYLKLDKLEMKFGDSSADKANALQIARQNSITYKIMDYQQGGTLGLELLYDYLNELQKNAVWE